MTMIAPIAAAPAGESPSPFARLAASRMLALLFLAGIAAAAGFSLISHSGAGLSDFSLFQRVSALFAAGDWLTAYDSAAFRALQRDWFGDGVFFPWTYPPPFAALIAPLHGLPPALAYGLFAGLPLAALLALLYRLGPGHLALTLLLIFPAIAVNLSAGQNGFITAALLALWALGARRADPRAGIPLGLMVIKPHLAITAALHTLMASGWRMTGFATLTLITISALATALMGFAVWPAFLNAARDAAHFLQGENYQFNRMISAYASFRGLGLDATAAMTLHALCALLVIALNGDLLWRRAPRETAIGFALLAALTLSPYSYDYDLPVAAGGIALLLPALLRHATRFDCYALLPGTFLIQLWGLQTTQWLQGGGAESAILGPLLRSNAPGLIYIALLLIVWRTLRRAMRDQADGVRNTNVLSSRYFTA